MYFDNIATLTAQNTVPLNTEFIVGGFYSPGDGGGGTFIWIPGSALSYPDTGITFNAVVDKSGYFKRIYSGPINVRWFGAIMGATDPNPPNDPNTGLPYPQPIADVTPYVHAARDSKEFANDGTLYFPKGVYPGAFDFTSRYGNPTFIRNEINIIGDGEGSVLKSNGTTGYEIPNGSIYNYPVLRLGYRQFHWRYAKVTNIKIDGSFQSVANRFSWGVTFESQGTPHGAEAAGRWIFEQVYFENCDRAVFKFAGNIGNSFLNCTFNNNNYGMYANAYAENGIGKMHNGCDRYLGGHFSGHTEAAIRYASDEEGLAGSGQIIIDGTIIENNPGWAIKMSLIKQSRMIGAAISIRNVWFEANGSETKGGDLFFEGIKSVRIDDSQLAKIWLTDSSVTLFNCRLDSDKGGIGGKNMIVDKHSSIVAYEHRYMSYPTSLIFVNSISYDGSQYLNLQNWQPTSVWGPLRLINTQNTNIIVSEHLDSTNEIWDHYGTSNFEVMSQTNSLYKLLGNGSNLLVLTSNTHIWSRNIVGTISSAGFYVWSIHTFLSDTYDAFEPQLHGEIASEDGFTSLGYVYFKKGQWACSYGLKYIVPNPSPIRIRLSFNTKVIPNDAQFYLTDYQIVKFNNLTDANAFVNSKEFAIQRLR